MDVLAGIIGNWQRRLGLEAHLSQKGALLRIKKRMVAWVEIRGSELIVAPEVGAELPYVLTDPGEIEDAFKRVEKLKKKVMP